jgi:NTP pyrophosphatase (non-canonical NTP hydrolase)
MTAYLENEIIQWAHEKGILGDNGKGTIIGQAGKMMEEHNEVVLALLSKDKDNLQSEIGDLYVTCVILASMHDLKMSDCILSAFKKIASRTGVMINGQFVKDKHNTSVSCGG